MAKDTALRLKVNTAGANAINELADIALKHGGLNTMQGVAQVLNSVEVDNDFFEKLDKEAEKLPKKYY